MAYYGGTTTKRPWPVVHTRALSLTGILLALVGSAVYLAVLLIVNLPKTPEPAPVAAIEVAQPAAKPVAVLRAEVLVASKNIIKGSRLNANQFNVELRPIQGIEDQVFQDLAKVRGLHAAANIDAGTILLADQTTSDYSANVVTAKIPEGFRGVSIPVDAERSVEGWARPGARVDVVWTTMHRNRRIVSTLVENAEVLSAERSADSSPDEAGSVTPGSAPPQHVTLLVSLKDAQRIQLAKEAGSLSLALRGDNDERSYGAETMTFDSLLKPIVNGQVSDNQGAVSYNGKSYVLREGKLTEVVVEAAPAAAAPEKSKATSEKKKKA